MHHPLTRVFAPTSPPQVSSAIDLSNNVEDKFANGATTATAEGSTALVQSAGGSFVNDNRQAVNVISSAKVICEQHAGGDGGHVAPGAL